MVWQLVVSSLLSLRESVSLFFFPKSIETQCCFHFLVGSSVRVSKNQTIASECTGQQNQTINLYGETRLGDAITNSSLERKWTAQTKRVDEIKFPPSILTSAGFPLSLEYCLASPSHGAVSGWAQHTGPGHKDVVCRIFVLIWWQKQFFLPPSGLCSEHKATGFALSRTCSQPDVIMLLCANSHSL